MRKVRMWLSPCLMLVAAVVVAMVAIEWSVAGVLAGLLGAMAGALAGLGALQAGLLGGALLLGVQVHRVVLGFGPRLVELGTPARPVVLRAIPLFLSVSVGPGRRPVRLRMWGAALCSTLGGLALCARLVISAVGHHSAFLHGMAITCCLAVAHALLPRKTAGATSTGWMLLRLHRLSPRQVRQMEAAQLTGRAIDAAHNGDLAGAERMAARLAEAYPDLRTAIAARIVVLEAMGRYAEAMVLAVKLASQLDQEPHEAAVSFAALAGLACTTVEAGQLDSELGLSTATTAMTNAETLGYPSYKLNGCRALLNLLRGNLDRAISLARLAAGAGDDVIGRADDLATLARAHMAAGDNRTARQVIGEAEKLVPWWPRVAGTRSRLEVC
ncbi:MAG: tetratricopeptide repeat protein [Labedaea sp.]